MSGLRFYSFGIVIKDKEINTSDIEVTPIEMLPLLSGKLEDISENYKFKLPDSNGVIRSVDVTSVSSLSARWWSLATSNRATAPDVCKGETVLLLKYADVEDIYWTSLFFEPKLRKLETVCYMYSNEKTPLKAFDKNSSYWFQVDTRNKTVQLHTSANDTEACEYDIILDCGAGTLIIKDSLGNYFTLYSKDGKLVGNINKEIDITAPKTIWTGDFKLVGNMEVTLTSKLDGAVTAGNTLDVKDVTTLEKDVNANANLNLVGNLNVGGTITGA